jgi:deoxyuridine 5'-triphosphate nucleotidohydrolase
MVLRFRKLRPDAYVPSRATPHSAGLDLHAPYGLIIPAGKQALIGTSLSVKLPKNCCGRIAPRSGLALRYSVDVLAGIIDADYQGEVFVLLINHGTEEFRITRGDRIAQLIVERILFPTLIEDENISEIPTERGTHGLGSSGT